MRNLKWVHYPYIPVSEVPSDKIRAGAPVVDREHMTALVQKVLTSFSDMSDVHAISGAFANTYTLREHVADVRTSLSEDVSVHFKYEPDMRKPSNSRMTLEVKGKGAESYARKTRLA
jgi:hypothetical protein